MRAVCDCPGAGQAAHNARLSGGSTQQQAPRVLEGHDGLDQGGQDGGVGAPHRRAGQHHQGVVTLWPLQLQAAPLGDIMHLAATSFSCYGHFCMSMCALAAKQLLPGASFCC